MAYSECTDVTPQSAFLQAPVPEAVDFFGHSIHLDGDRLVVGAPQYWFDVSEAYGPGEVHVYDHTGSNWQHLAELVPASTTTKDAFGASVDVSGDFVIVGEPLEFVGAGNDEAGRVTIFDGASSWASVASITMPSGDLEPESRFGWSVAIDGDIALIGSPGAGAGSGRVYAYERQTSGTWLHVHTFAAPNPAVNDAFGWSVAFDGVHLAIGAPSRTVTTGEGSFPNAGAAFVYDLSDPDPGQWTLAAELVASDPGEEDHFGWSVGISGGRVAVGAPEEDTGSGECTCSGSGVATCDRGTVYLFASDGLGAWSQFDRIALGAPDCALQARFGTSLDFTGDALVVGTAPADSSGGPEGRADLYSVVESGTIRRAQLVAQPAGQDDLFGGAVATNGLDAVVTARDWYVPDFGVGRTATFDSVAGFTDCDENGVPDSCEALDCNGNGVPDACDVAAQTSEDCNANFVPDECEAYAPVEIVIVVDSSGSTIAGLQRACAILDTAIAIVQDASRDVCVSWRRIDSHTPTQCPALDAAPTVGEAYFDIDQGNPVPLPAPAPPCCPNLDDDESWGGAVAIVAAAHPWTPARARLIIPVSDEGPWDGGFTCNADGSDDAIVAYAASIVAANDCLVVPLAETLIEPAPCALTSMATLATLGAFGRTTGGQAAQDLAAKIIATLPYVGTDCNNSGDHDLCDPSEGPHAVKDCNSNGLDDACDIALGWETDVNANGTPDACEIVCDEDFDGDFMVGFTDLVILLSAWGPCSGCPADLDGNGSVEFNDLLALLANWGWCYDAPGCTAPNPANSPPQSIFDCLQRVGTNPEKLTACIEAMMLNGTP